MPLRFGRNVRPVFGVLGAMNSCQVKGTAFPALMKEETIVRHFQGKLDSSTQP
jgi:hypothetical protein